MLKLCYMCEKAIPNEYVEVRLANPRKTEIYLFCSWDCLKKFVPVIIPASEVKQPSPEPQVKPKNGGQAFNVSLPTPAPEHERLYSWFENQLDSLKEKGLIVQWNLTVEKDNILYWITPAQGQESRIKRDIERQRDWVLKQIQKVSQ